MSIKMKGNQHQLNADEDFHLIEETRLSFIRSIHELLNDDAFSGVRQEIDKLHSAFLRTHQQNLALVDRVNSLNHEIQNNAGKIATVLSLSQENSKRISTLRKEFENACTIVEACETRRCKSQDVIYTLKEEASNLRTLIDQEKHYDRPNLSLQSTMESIKKAKHDIESNSNNIKEMINSIESIKTQTVTIQKEILNQQEQENMINQEILKLDMQLTEFENHTKQANETTSDGNSEISKQKEIILMLKQEKEKKLERIDKLQLDLRNENRMIEAITDHTNLIYRKQQQKLKELPKYQKLTSLTEKRCDYANEQHEYADARFIDVQRQNKRISRELNETRQLHKVVHDFRDNINQQHEIVLTEYKSKQKELTAIKSKVTASNLINRQGRNDVSAANLELINIEKDKEKEEVETSIALKEVDLAKRECTTIKKESQEHKKINQRIENDVLKSEQNKMNFSISIEIDNATSKQNQQMIDDLAFSLTEINDQISQQNNWTDLLTSDRDNITRSLQKLIQINEEKTQENQYLSKDIDKLQNEIRVIDTELIDMHVKTQETQEYNKKISSKITEIISNTKETRKKIESFNQEKQKIKAIEREARKDIEMKTKLVEEIKIQNTHIEEQLTKKKIESDMLYEKCNLIQIEMRDFQLQFDQQFDKTEKLKVDLNCVIQKRNDFLRKIKDLNKYQNEIIRFEKMILQAKTEAEILEEEIANPRLLHRYILMESTNPTLLFLIHTHEDLVDQIWKLISISDEKSKEKSELIEQLNRKTIHLQQCKTADLILAEIESIQKTIQRKEQQLSLLKEHLNEKRPITTNKGQLISSMKSQLRGCKVLNNSEPTKKSSNENNSNKEPQFDEIEYFDFKSMNFTTQPPKTASVKYKRNDKINSEFEFNRDIKEPDSNCLNTARRTLTRPKNKHIIGGGFVMKNEMNKSTNTKISNFNYQVDTETAKHPSNIYSPREKPRIVFPIPTDRRSNRTQNSPHSKSHQSLHRLTLRSDRVPVDDLY